MPREEFDEVDDPGRARHPDCGNQRELRGGEAQGRGPATRVLGQLPGSSSARPPGFFKEAGLEVEVFYTEGGAQTIATVASGSVDIAMSNGILGAIGAYVKGGDATPYRIISAEMTGANELFWWVKADSPIKSPERRRRQDHRVLLARFLVEPDPAHVAQADRLQGQAGADRRRAGNLHAGHDRPDRHRLVGGAARLEGCE